MRHYHSYDPAQGHHLPHDPLKAVIAPRPIAWVSTLDGEGRANLAPYSYFNLFSHSPPIVIFGSEGEKDTLRNLRLSGEYVLNLATRAQAEAVNLSSAALPPGEDEFDFAGLEKLASEIVAPPRVAGAAAALECRVIEIKPLAGLDGTAASTIIIGQILRVHLAMDCLVEGRFDMAKAGTIARCGYRGDYIQAERFFELLRPKV